MKLYELVAQHLDRVHNADSREDLALELVMELENRFNWAVTMFTRKDVETLLGRELAHEEWQEVQRTHAWRDTSSIMLELSEWEPVRMAIEEAGLEEEPNQ